MRGAWHGAQRFADSGPAQPFAAVRASRNRGPFGATIAPLQVLIYWAIASFLWLVTRVFFRTIEVVGLDHVPRTGPVIFVGNHPNSLVDPVMLLSHAPRRISFAARDGLFSMPHLMPLLWAMGAVPIKRKQDQAEGTAAVDNSAAFSALHRVLGRGDAFGIFPEGVTYTESELQPLKTGAARIALSAVSEGIPVVMVPVGLSYRRRDRFRGRVLVQFGQPIDLTAWAKASADPSARALTADIELALRALTINADDFDTLRVLDGVRRLYVPDDRTLSLGEQAEVTRRLVAHWTEKRELPEVRAYYDDVGSYLAILEAMDLSDWDMKKPISKLAWGLRITRHAFLVMVLLPLAIPGLVLHLPFLYFATRAGEMVISRDDVKATFRMMVATSLILLSYALIFASVVLADPHLGGVVSGASAVVFLAVSGLAAIRVLERQYVIRHGVAVLGRIMALKDQLETLRAERDALRRRLIALVEVHIDPKLRRIVSQEEQARSQR